MPARAGRAAHQRIGAAAQRRPSVELVVRSHRSPGLPVLRRRDRPGAGRSGDRRVQRRLVHRQSSVDRRKDPLSVSVIVSVTVEVSPSPSVMVYTNVSVAPAGGTTFGVPS